MRWFVVQAFSGFEGTVKRSLEERITRAGLDEKFGDILVPTEEVVEIRNGQKRRSERKFFPGYVLVRMEMEDETWHLVKDVPKVLGFIGGTADRPAPISDKEADSILQRVQDGVEKPRPKVLFDVGEVVRVTDGPFNDFNGVVGEVNFEKNRLLVEVKRSRDLWLQRKRLNPSGVFSNMAKKVQAYIKLQVPAGQANPSPPVGPALGQHGVNIMEFCKAFNASTQSVEAGLPIPVVITVYNDRSFTYIQKTPPASVLLRKITGIAKGSGRPNTEKVGKVTRAQLEEIATTKDPDLTASDMDAAVKTIAGTARSMGLEVEG